MKSPVASRQLPVTKRACSIAVAIALIVGAPVRDAFAYLKFGTNIGGREVPLRWSILPVRYYINDQGVPGVSASEFQAAIGSAFSTWQNVPTAAVSYQLAGFTSARPGEGDGM